MGIFLALPLNAEHAQPVSALSFKKKIIRIVSIVQLLYKRLHLLEICKINLIWLPAFRNVSFSEINMAIGSLLNEILFRNNTAEQNLFCCDSPSTLKQLS